MMYELCLLALYILNHNLYTMCFGKEQSNMAMRCVEIHGAVITPPHPTKDRGAGLPLTYRGLWLMFHHDCITAAHRNLAFGQLFASTGCTVSWTALSLSQMSLCNLSTTPCSTEWLIVTARLCMYCETCTEGILL